MDPWVTPLVEAGEIRPSRSTVIEDGDSRTLSIINFSFESGQARVGESVVWTNVDSVLHTVTAGSRGVATGAYDSGLIAPGQTFVRRFDHPGQFSFTCPPHPARKATVTVPEQGLPSAMEKVR